MSEAAQFPARSLPAPFEYPQRRDTEPSWTDDLEAAARGLLLRVSAPWLGRSARRRVAAINARAPELAECTEVALGQEVSRVRHLLRRGSLTVDAVTASFALIREIARRRIGLRHHDVQLMGGLVMLDGMIAEMETGEGKTLAATLTAGTVALSGTPVHVVTVNDYLAERDAEQMGPIYRALGLSVGVIRHGLEPEARRVAYASDIVYASNKEIVFDYLRDRLSLGPLATNIRLKLEELRETESRRRPHVMRGLHFAIVDEADSILIDEARTPLVISRETSPLAEEAEAREKMLLVETLEHGKDFEVIADERRIVLTEQGRRSLEDSASALGRIWQSRIRREDAARQALSALHLFRPGEQYIVQDDTVRIVDEYTGRVMSDRSWNSGLHQLVELKEGVAVTGRKDPVARISYQRFFRRYLRLAGMTGTASEVSAELKRVYGLGAIRIPTHRPPQRRVGRDGVHANERAKWRAVTEEAAVLARDGRAVLIGTRSVRASEEVSAQLSSTGIEHVVLNALQDREEAEIIATAGRPGRITVATNMAGRGVDIRVDPAVLARGGLHVILSEYHEARRIDRQLFGRCARQGEPGSCRVSVSLEDELIVNFGTRTDHLFAALGRGPLRPLSRWAFRRAQNRAEQMHAQARRDLFRIDRTMGTLLSFTGDSQ